MTMMIMMDVDGSASPLAHARVSRAAMWVLMISSVVSGAGAAAAVRWHPSLLLLQVINSLLHGTEVKELD